MVDILAIVGSTYFDKDSHSWWTARNFIIKFLKDDMLPDQIISGMALGIDSIAEYVAKTVLDLNFKGYPPKNPVWEPDGFKARNIEIAETCTRLLCIRHYNSNTYGSGWTADYAERNKKHVERYVYTPNSEIIQL